MILNIISLQQVCISNKSKFTQHLLPNSCRALIVDVNPKTQFCNKLRIPKIFSDLRNNH